MARAEEAASSPEPEVGRHVQQKLIQNAKTPEEGFKAAPLADLLAGTPVQILP